MVRTKHFHFHECEVCFNSFKAERITAKYCSHKCRQEAYRDRIRDKKYLMKQEKEKLETLSVTQAPCNVAENASNVTNKTGSVTVASPPEVLASPKEPNANGTEPCTGSYRHASESVASPSEANDVECNLPEEKEKLKRCLEKLQSLDNTGIKRYQIKFLAHDLNKAWVNVKRESMPLRCFYSSLVEKEILPLLNKMISGINNGSAVFRFRITDDLRNELNALIKWLE